MKDAKGIEGAWGGGSLGGGGGGGRCRLVNVEMRVMLVH